jgi:hypothetical protein
LIAPSACAPDDDITVCRAEQHEREMGCFQANLNTPKNLAVGASIPITITVMSGTTTIGTASTSITVTR